MNKKKLISLIASFLIASSCTLFANAAQTSEPTEFIVDNEGIHFISGTNIEPRWKFISSCGLTFTPTGRSIKIVAYTNYYSDIATSASATVNLDRYINGSWESYESWTDTSYNDLPAAAGDTITVPAGKYRCISVHTATDGSFTESKTIDGGSKTIS